MLFNPSIKKKKFTQFRQSILFCACWCLHAIPINISFSLSNDNKAPISRTSRRKLLFCFGYRFRNWRICVSLVPHLPVMWWKTMCLCLLKPSLTFSFRFLLWYSKHLKKNSDVCFMSWRNTNPKFWGQCLPGATENNISKHTMLDKKGASPLENSSRAEKK